MMNIRLQHFVTFSALAIFSVTLAGCRRGVTPPATLGPVPIEARLYQDNGGGMRSASERVVRDATTWQQVWREATSAQAPPPAVPEVDFQRQMLLVVAAGRMSVRDGVRVDSVGARQEVNQAGKREEVLAVYYSILRGCPPSTLEAYPVEIVRVRRFADTVRFVSATVPGQGCR